jgi:L-aspartate oxidase
MLEVLVFAKRIMEKTKKGRIITAPRQNEIRRTLVERKRVKKATSAPSLSALQQLHWDKVGIIRNQVGLTQAAETLAAWQESLPPPSDRPSYELNNLVLAGRLMTEAALLREESRGAHFRADFPQLSPEWHFHIVFTSGETSE